jgi:putative Mg2+ transporter-C (MgtC) family protein
MNQLVAHFAHPLSFDWLEQMLVANGAVGRLLLACFLGALVGLERQAKRTAAGVRTNLLICMGAAFFTLLSAVIAGDGSQNRGQVASNIVQGIGFLGAGLILHNKNRISGLTSAASVWVTVIVTLELVGLLERRANLKAYPLLYEARGRDQTAMLRSILDAMDKNDEHLGVPERDTIGETERISFCLTATNQQHRKLSEQLRAEPAIDALLIFRDPEED